MGLNVEIKSIAYPRKEIEEHYWNPAHTGLVDLGLKPHILTDDSLGEIIQKVVDYKDLIEAERFFRGVKWLARRIT